MHSRCNNSSLLLLHIGLAVVTPHRGVCKGETNDPGLIPEKKVSPSNDIVLKQKVGLTILIDKAQANHKELMYDDVRN